jgi:hypothetical protein
MCLHAASAAGCGNDLTSQCNLFYLGRVAEAAEFLCLLAAVPCPRTTPPMIATCITQRLCQRFAVGSGTTSLPKVKSLLHCSPGSVMGCGDSKQTGVKAQPERKPAPEASTSTPQQARQQPPEAQPVAQTPPPPQLSTPVATSVPTGSLSKRAAAGGNAAIYAASIDRRNHEVEFFKNIVRQTEE